jgi:uncharacterized protein (DUF58 family)
MTARRGEGATNEATRAAHEYGALLDAVRGIRWRADRRPPHAVTGAHEARRTAPSMEVMAHRPYRQGDDPRRLDWKLLARTERAYIRLAPSSSIAPTLLVVDASASMAAPPGGAGKWRVARHVTIGVAAIARAAGDPVGLAIAHADASLRLAPRGRGDVVRELMRVLDATAPAGDAACAPLLAPQRAVARVVIVSDLLGDADAMRAAAATLVAHGTELHVAHVVAAGERALAMAGAIAVDPEDDGLRRPLARTAALAHDATFAAWRAEERAAWQRIGARYLEVDDALPAATWVRRLAAARDATGREPASPDGAAPARAAGTPVTVGRA